MIPPVTAPAGVPATPARAPGPSVIPTQTTDDRATISTPSVKIGATASARIQPQPMTYYGGIEGMNAANLIVALQSNGTVSGGYSAKAIESGGTPPPAIVDRGA